VTVRTDGYSMATRCRLDIISLCTVTSCATAGMMYHKFNYRLIETEETYFKRPRIYHCTECSAANIRFCGFSQHRLELTAVYGI
jgi:hypothetical protein